MCLRPLLSVKIFIIKLVVGKFLVGLEVALALKLLREFNKSEKDLRSLQSIFKSG